MDNSLKLCKARGLWKVYGSIKAFTPRAWKQSQAGKKMVQTGLPLYLSPTGEGSSGSSWLWVTLRSRGLARYASGVCNSACKVPSASALQEPEGAGPREHRHGYCKPCSLPATESHHVGQTPESCCGRAHLQSQPVPTPFFPHHRSRLKPKPEGRQIPLFTTQVSVPMLQPPVPSPGSDMLEQEPEEVKLGC